MKKIVDFKRFFQRFKEQEEGSVMIIVAVAMVVILGMTAFVVDLGLYDYNKSKLQTAFDSAALAACQKLPNTGAAEVTAKEYMVKNGYSGDDVIVTFEKYNPSDPAVNVIKLKSEKEQKTLFANILGVKKFNYSCTTKAKFTAQVLATDVDVENGLGAFPYTIYASYAKTPSPGKPAFPLANSNKFIFTGSGHVVKGTMHSNYLIDAGSTVAFAGQAVETVTGANIATKVNGADYVPMPDFSKHKPTIYAEALAANRVFVGRFDKDVWKARTGSTNCDITSPIYIMKSTTGLLKDKKADTNLTGLTFSGNGCIYSEGPIHATGMNTAVGSDPMISIYSDYVSGLKSDAAIDFAGSSKAFNGMLYAPHGVILFTGSGYTFNGSCIAGMFDTSGSDKVWEYADVSASFPYTYTTTTTTTTTQGSGAVLVQ